MADILCEHPPNMVPYFKTIKKNSAYGRHQSFWPMQIDAPIQKETYKDIFLLLGIWLGRGGGAAVHTTAEHWFTFLSIELHCTSFPCSAPFFFFFQCTAIEFSGQHWTSLYIKLLICSALYCTGLHCSPYYALHCTALGKVFKSLVIINICICNTIALLFYKWL